MPITEPQPRAELRVRLQLTVTVQPHAPSEAGAGRWSQKPTSYPAQPQGAWLHGQPLPLRGGVRLRQVNGIFGGEDSGSEASRAAARV